MKALIYFILSVGSVILGILKTGDYITYNTITSLVSATFAFLAGVSWWGLFQSELLLEEEREDVLDDIM